MCRKNYLTEFAGCAGLLVAALMLIGCRDTLNTTAQNAPLDAEAIANPNLSNGTTVESGGAEDANLVTSAPEPSSSAHAKTKREPIYIEESNGAELIGAALKIAQRDHKHVLVEWGGNWCGWCYKLHDVFHNDPAVQPIVHEEFVLVLIDSGTNKDLMSEYCERVTGYPHLTVLDESGKVLTNQETGSLEEGPNHDPKLVANFLTKWMPAKVDAIQLLTDAKAKAAAESKHVLIRVGTPYCGWCTVLAQFVQDHAELFEIDYVDTKVDTQRMLNAEQALAQFESKKSGGVPWMAIIDESGKELATSFGPSGNIGYPYQPNEINYFISMLRKTRQRLTDDDLSKIAADLNAYRDEREKGAK